MGRKKNYNRDTLIKEAMEIFRDHGYAGTSTQMLVEELGVNRFSLYAEFGNKQKLFHAALERYNQDVIEPRFSPLEASSAGLEEIKALLTFYGSAGKGAAWGRGCFLCNTAVEFGPLDPGGDAYIQRYFKRLARAFYRALKNAQDKGDLGSTVNLNKKADFLTASTLGLFVLIRAKAPPETLENAASMAIEHLNELQT